MLFIAIFLNPISGPSYANPSDIMQTHPKSPACWCKLMLQCIPWENLIKNSMTNFNSIKMQFQNSDTTFWIGNVSTICTMSIRSQTHKLISAKYCAKTTSYRNFDKSYNTQKINMTHFGRNFKRQIYQKSSVYNFRRHFADSQLRFAHRRMPLASLCLSPARRCALRPCGCSPNERNVDKKKPKMKSVSKRLILNSYLRFGSRNGFENLILLFERANFSNN